MPARTCLVTHRCHDRKFLLRFAVDGQEFKREARWAEILAAGSGAFVTGVGGQIDNRMEVEIVEETNRAGVWVVYGAAPAFTKTHRRRQKSAVSPWKQHFLLRQVIDAIEKLVVRP